MMKCKEVGPLIDKEEFESLPFRKRVGMKFHLMMCKLCTGYKKDARHMTDVIKMAKVQEGEALSSEEKDRMKAHLVNHNH